MPEAKAATIDEYLAGLSQEQRAGLEKLRKVIRAAAPEATETISWSMPAFKYKGTQLVGFAAFKNHLSFFPYSGNALKQFEEELAGFTMTKGTVHFSPDKPIPDALVKKIVKARMRENEQRAVARRN